MILILHFACYFFCKKNQTLRGFPLRNNLYALFILNVVLVMSEKGGTYLCRHLSMQIVSTTNQRLPKCKNISVNIYIKQPVKL
jgi:hypothetical protein